MSAEEKLLLLKVAKRIDDLHNVPALMGERGDVGPQGIQGPPGVDGRDGREGLQGLTGPQGEAGPQGAKGEKGERGDPGEQGPEGDKGERGERGFTGEPGPRGERGETGERGPKGPKGDKGEKGDKGDKGDGFRWRGEWLSTETYEPRDVVFRLGSSWIGIRPYGAPGLTDGWELMAQRGNDGGSVSSGGEGGQGMTDEERAALEQAVEDIDALESDLVSLVADFESHTHPEIAALQSDLASLVADVAAVEADVATRALDSDLAALEAIAVTLTGTQTLTNKTLTDPTINGAAFSGTLSGSPNFSGSPTVGSAAIVTTTGTQTLTNKTLTSARATTDFAPSSHGVYSLGTNGLYWTQVYLNQMVLNAPTGLISDGTGNDRIRLRASGGTGNEEHINRYTARIPANSTQSAHILNNAFALTDATAELLSIRNNDVEQVRFDKDGQMENVNSGKGVILRSPNGTRYLITVDNAGAISAASI